VKRIRIEIQRQSTLLNEEERMALVRDVARLIASLLRSESTGEQATPPEKPDATEAA
jgi:hypothetical protein